MKTKDKSIPFIFVCILCLCVLLTSGWGEKIDDIEVRWPAGVDSPEKARDISVTGPCLLVVRVTIDPFYKKLNWPYGWGHHNNSIPPFPYGKNISEGRAWENGVPIEWLRAKNGSMVFLEMRHKITQKGPYGGKLILVPPQMRNLAGAFQNQFKQFFKITFDTYPLETALPWGPKGKILNPDVLNGTSWSVGGHPVHWIFHKDGTVEAPRLWKGTWKATSEGYLVTIIHQGVADSFLIKLSADGKRFTAYKGGRTYRQGIRVK